MMGGSPLEGLARHAFNELCGVSSIRIFWWTVSLSLLGGLFSSFGTIKILWLKLERAEYLVTSLLGRRKGIEGNELARDFDYVGLDH